ncbi:MAG: hypothetical protein QM733_13485 [Ilumatobacteraceae bacterium]
MSGTQTSAGPGDPAGDDATGDLQRPRPNVVQISTYTPPPGADVGIRSQVSYGGPVVFARRVHPWRTLLLVAVVAGLLGIGGVWVYRAVQRAQHRTDASAPVMAPSTSNTPASATDGTPAPPTLPPVGNLFDASAAALIAPAVEAAAPGEPSQFTSISVYPGYAVATVRDPDNTTRTVRLTIRGADVVTDEPVTQTADVTPSLFTVADVDWSRVAPLVAESPTDAGLPDDTVDRVEILRWGFDPAYPMRMLVYLSGGKMVEAAMDGTVVAVH